MKFKARYKDGEKKIKKGFLFFPKRLQDEIRWLEVAWWEERYNYIGPSCSYWTATKWEEKEEKNDKEDSHINEDCHIYEVVWVKNNKLKCKKLNVMVFMNLQ